jgi:hypothetical protein
VVRPIAHTKTLAINLVQSRFEPLSQLAQDFAMSLRETVKTQGFAIPLSAKQSNAKSIT